MENDALGRVAHLHVALCDILDEGACHPIAIELAKSQSVAVDFPKTGKIPKVPAVALETVEQNGYPDFMEKAWKSYPSEKLLGKLFRRVDAIEVNDDQFFDEEWERPTPDPTLLIPDRQKFERETQETYRHYCYDLTCLANRFGLKREEEVFLGRALHWHPLFKSNKGKAMIVSWHLDNLGPLDNNIIYALNILKFTWHVYTATSNEVLKVLKKCFMITYSLSLCDPF